MRRRIGPSRTDFAKRAAAARRHAEHIRYVDPRDLGTRADFADEFGAFTFRQKARAWFARCPF